MKNCTGVRLLSGNDSVGGSTGVGKKKAEPTEELEITGHEKVDLCSLRGQFNKGQPNNR